MRAGKLDRVIVVQEVTQTPDDYGNFAEAWTALHTLRAQVIEATTEEFLRAYGEHDERLVVFRTHYVVGLKTSHRIVFEGADHNIREIKELGRRRGLEIRTVRQ